MNELKKLKYDVREEVKEWIRDYKEENPEATVDEIEEAIDDILYEIADSNVPVYTSDLMELATEPEIYNNENELPPAFDGKPTLINVTATSVYEVLLRTARETKDEMIDELRRGEKYV